MRTLRDALGDRFVAGVMLYPGPLAHTAGDRLYVVPVDRLWTPRDLVASGAAALAAPGSDALEVEPVTLQPGSSTGSEALAELRLDPR